MRGDNRLVNIRFNDGAVKRLPLVDAEVHVELGRAKFISNTLYKAAVFGVKVRPGQSEAEIRAEVRTARLSKKERDQLEAAAEAEAEVEQAEPEPTPKVRRGKRRNRQQQSA